MLILPSFSKILEMTVANPYFYLFNIQYSLQMSVRIHRNTTQAVLSLIDYLINSLENNERTCGAFLDIF